jgi:hypothetical protein
VLKDPQTDFTFTFTVERLELLHGWFLRDFYCSFSYRISSVVETGNLKVSTANVRLFVQTFRVSLVLIFNYRRKL